MSDDDDYTISQEELWRLPERSTYGIQEFNGTKWVFKTVHMLHITDHHRRPMYLTAYDQCKATYDEIQDTAFPIRIVRISRFLPKGTETPAVIEILKYKEPKA